MEPTTVARFIDNLGPAFEAGDPAAGAKAAEAGNVARVREMYRAPSRGDAAAFGDMLSDDVHVLIAGPAGAPFAGEWRGRAGALEAVGRNFSQVEDQRPEVLTLVAQGDTVVVSARERGRCGATGKIYDLHFVQIYTFRNGRICAVRMVFDTAGLCEAARA